MKIYRVTHYGRPLAVREGLDSHVPHADMLRYDIAFHDPADPSRVVFPVAKHGKHGSTTRNITHDRWASFGMRLEATSEVLYEGATNWIGFKHNPPDYGTLVAQTLGEWLTENKLKLTGGR